MGPVERWDTIDDFCNDANWRKTVRLGKGRFCVREYLRADKNLVTTAWSLLQKMTLAIPQAVIHHRAFLAFTESLQVEHASNMAEWELSVEQWEQDHSLSCPYDIPDQCES